MLFRYEIFRRECGNNTPLEGNDGSKADEGRDHLNRGNSHAYFHAPLIVSLSQLRRSSSLMVVVSDLSHFYVYQHAMLISPRSADVQRLSKVTLQ